MPFTFHQTITLISDPAFVGLVEGAYNRAGEQRAPELLITVVEPGATGHAPRSIRPFPESDLLAVDERHMGRAKQIRMAVSGV